MKYKIVTLGCRTNQYESQGFSDQLRKMGYSEALEGDKADLCIVNTCTVTEQADATSRLRIRQLTREHEGARLVVTGCMAESAPNVIAAIDSKIQIVPNQEKERLIEAIFPDEKDLPEFKIERFEAHTRAFLKVQDGCNSYCTYCIIPYVRGRSRSKGMKEILEEAHTLARNGYKEIVLTGINIGDFEDGEVRLAGLVRAIDNIEGIERVRISSIDPDEVDDELADAVINGRHTCPSMHLVLQSGSNVVLKRMNRKYTRQIFLDTVERMVKRNPDFTVTTDIIVGFPGESDADFEDTLEVVRQVKFAKVHFFPYSPRDRTRAALYPNRVPHDVMKKRKSDLLRLSEKTAFELRDRFVGRTFPVLLEEGDSEFISGHTPNFLKVRMLRGSFQKNQIVEAKMMENTPDALFASPL
jgi:threonylcarbamoyladenosine tRNA methylthiotransferase MtaB